MPLYAVIFYLVATVILVSTGLAISRRNPVHAVVYLIISFLGSAVLFYLLGAPFLAALEVLIYAGAILVLFLFVIMMPRSEATEAGASPSRQWGPAILLALLFLTVAALLVHRDPGSQVVLETASATPSEFGRFLFERYWLAVEILSLLLLIALVAAIQLGRGGGRRGLGAEGEDEA